MALGQDKSIYLPDHTYNQLKERLVHLIGDQSEGCGTDAATEVVAALGEIADIWPELIRSEN
ncbi:hypothetical protein Z945_1625 [Sulfitobacter noctilucae]|nr:hypothetical protein Z945_1625 [Sulfitobacter noctilucae]